MLKHRVLIGKGGDNVLKLRPSLAWDKHEVDILIRALDASLTSIAQG